MGTRPTHGDVDRMHSLTASLRTTELPGWMRQVLDPAVLTHELRGRVAELVPDAVDLTDVRVRDVRARRAWSLLLDAHVITTDGTRTVNLAAERPVPGTGHRPRSTPRSRVVDLPALGLDVVVVHGEPRLPALAALTDPAAALPLLEAILRSGGLPGIRLARVRPRLVRLKPWHRATVAHDLGFAGPVDPAWPRTVLTKTYGDDRGSSTAAWMRALWECDLSGEAGAPRLAEPLGYDADHRTLLQRALTGTAILADAVRTPGVGDPDRVEQSLRATADALVALHRCQVAAGPERTVATQLASARRLADRVGPSLPGRIRHDTGGLLALLSDIAGDRPAGAGPVHGAFRPGQVLLSDAGPGFLDFDDFGQGEPAIDVGSFVARLSELVPDRGRHLELSHVFVDRYRAATGLRPDRITLWVMLALATGAVRSWYRARTEHASRLLGLLDEAAGIEW